MSDWASTIKVPEKPTYLDLQVGMAKTVKFLNDDPRMYMDPTWNKQKIAFDVEYEGKITSAIFNTSNFSAMYGLKALYPISGKTVTISKSGSRLKPMFSFVLVG